MAGVPVSNPAPTILLIQISSVGYFKLCPSRAWAEFASKQLMNPWMIHLQAELGQKFAFPSWSLGTRV